MADLVFDGKWKVVRTIGAGGMGTVYEVQHQRLPRRRALKQLKKELLDNPKVKDRFTNEARLMCELDHEHIVTVHDVDVDEENGEFILMDLIEGSNLAQTIQKTGRLPYREALRICREIASALEFAHSKGVVHRDLKPGNILIELRTGRAMLTDFGIAKQLRGGADETTGDPTTSFVGTYRYSSPEQMKSEEIDSRADLYSLGVVLYEACTGHRYLSEVREEAIPAHVMGYIPGWQPQVEFPDDVPEGLRALVRDCLALDRDGRVANAGEIVRRLRECESAIPEGGASAENGSGPDLAAHTEVTREEGYTEQRAASRASAEAALARIDRIGKQAEGLGIAFDDDDTLAGLREELAEIDALEESRSFAIAYRRLHDLRDEASAVVAGRQSRLSAALSAALAEHEDLWAELLREAADLVGEEVGKRRAELAADVQRNIDAGEFTQAGSSLAQMPPLVAAARADARQQAESRLNDLIARAAELRRELQDAGAMAVLEGVEAETDALRSQARAEVAEGHLQSGVERARALCSRLEDARRGFEQQQRAQLEAARAAADTIRAALDTAEAEEVAGASLRDLEAAYREASQAAERGELARASELYRRVVELGEQIDEALTRHRGERFEQEKRSLAELVESAEAAADEVVAPARQEALAATALEIADPESLRRVVAAQKRLRDALAEDGLRRGALEQRERAAQAAATVDVEALPRGDVEAARRALARADAELDAGRWQRAGEAYAAALAVWEELRRRQISQEQAALEERLRSAARALEEYAALVQSGTAVGLDLAGVAVEDEAGLREALRGLGHEVEQVEPAEAQRRVSDLSTAVAAAVDTARARLAEALAAELDAAAAASDAEIARAGRFAPDAGGAAVAALIASLRSYLDGGELAQAIEQRPELDREQLRFAAAVRAAAGEEISRAVDESHRLARRLDELEGEALFDFDELSREIDRLCDDGDWEAACARAEAVERDLHQACEGAGERLVERARASEVEARRGVEGLPLDANEIAVAERDAAAAKSAAERREWEEAARLYEVAVASWSKLVETGRRRAQEISAARAELEPLVARASAAPPEVVSAVLEQAKGLLAEPSPEPGPLREVAATVSAALAAVPRFEQARAQRDRFSALLREREGEGAARRSLKASRKTARVADAAFARGAWDDASQAWKNALEQLPAVPAEGRRGSRRGPAVAGSVLVGGVALAVYLSGIVTPPPTRTPVPENVTPGLETTPPVTVGRERITPERREPSPGATAPAPVPRVASIASAVPAKSEVSVAEKKSIDFTIDVENADESTVPEWTLDGEVVASARGKNTWKYEPDYDANASSPHRVVVSIGKGDGQSKQWDVRVDDVNRLPQVKTVPPSGKTLEARVGDSLRFQVDATDPDGDPLSYQWKDGSKKIGDGASLNLKVKGKHDIRAFVSDGRADPVSVGPWKVALASLPPLDLSPRPARLQLLDFDAAQNFSLDVPSSLRRAGVNFSWTLNGKSVSRSSSYQFSGTDPSLVRSGRPVVVAVHAAADGYVDYEHEWRFQLRPPKPRIVNASPNEAKLRLALGKTQTFALEAASAVGEQAFTYVFSSGGKESRSSQPKFDLVADKNQTYTVVASIEDNFGQKSAERRWVLEPANDEAAIRAWLDALLAAERAGNCDEVARLRRVRAEARQRLCASLKTKSDLKLDFSNVKFDAQGAARYRVSYRRREEFRDPAGRKQSFDVEVNESLRLEGNSVFPEPSGGG